VAQEAWQHAARGLEAPVDAEAHPHEEGHERQWSQ
jgi:hypothetical protein